MCVLDGSAAATPIFQGFRSDKGEAMILDRNMFVERVLPGSVLRKLGEAEIGGIPQAVPGTRRALADADLAAPNSDRGRAR